MNIAPYSYYAYRRATKSILSNNGNLLLQTGLTTTWCTTGAIHTLAAACNSADADWFLCSIAN